MKTSIITMAMVIATFTVMPLDTQTETSAIVERLEDNNMAVIEVVHNDNIYMGDVPVHRINGNVVEGLQIPIRGIQGKFSMFLNELDGQVYYNFKPSNGSNDWWTLSESELGFKPSVYKEYTIFVSDNWTTTCPNPEYHEEYCECAIYDDFFVCVKGD